MNRMMIKNVAVSQSLGASSARDLQASILGFVNIAFCCPFLLLSLKTNSLFVCSASIDAADSEQIELGDSVKVRMFR